jgi:hypothetical protein
MQPLAEVGRSEEAVLLCDMSHDGPCVWPGYLGTEGNVRDAAPSTDMSSESPIVDTGDAPNEVAAAALKTETDEDHEAEDELAAAALATETAESEG